MPNLKRNRALANHRRISIYEIAYGAVTVVFFFFFFKVNVVDLSIRLCNYYNNNYPLIFTTVGSRHCVIK